MGKCTSAPKDHGNVTTDEQLETIWKETIYEDANEFRLTNKQISLKPQLPLNRYPLIEPEHLSNIHSNPIFNPIQKCVFFTYSIFMNESKLFAFIATYCRLCLSHYKNICIPQDIINLFREFYDAPQCELPPTPTIDLSADNGTKSIMCIMDEKEHIYHQLYLYETDWIGHTDIMRITVLTNFTMTNRSRIISYPKGTIILNVMGDIHLEEETQIICPDGGNILIKCNNLYVGTYADIQTCDSMNNHFINFNVKLDDDDNNKSTLYGNIAMEIKDNMIIYGYNNIQSGDIKINCGGSVEFWNKSITMSALRKDLKINARNIDIMNKKGLKATDEVILNINKN